MLPATFKEALIFIECPKSPLSTPDQLKAPGFKPLRALAANPHHDHPFENYRIIDTTTGLTAMDRATLFDKDV